MSHRVRWSENYPTGTVYITADYTADRGWDFAERDGYEVQWFPLAATPHLVAKATGLLAQQVGSQPSTLIQRAQGGLKMNEINVIRGGNLSTVTSDKSWGYETLFGVTPRVALKQVSVRSNEALSRQVHLEKDELYLVVEGHGRLELGREGEIVHELGKGDVVHVPPGVVHRLVAARDGIVIIEASTPELTDIIRLDDRYGRPVNDNFDAAAYRDGTGR
jgi:mannose-6-phosphate isomerase